MNDKLSEKDSPQTQKQRIERLALEINPFFRVEFYVNHVNPSTADIRFKIYDNSTNQIVCSIKQDEEWASTEITDKNDRELSRKIAALISNSDSPC
jgi:hypothetical protein